MSYKGKLAAKSLPHYVNPYEGCAPTVEAPQADVLKLAMVKVSECLAVGSHHD